MTKEKMPGVDAEIEKDINGKGGNNRGTEGDEGDKNIPLPMKIHRLWKHRLEKCIKRDGVLVPGGLVPGLATF